MFWICLNCYGIFRFFSGPGAQKKKYKIISNLSICLVQVPGAGGLPPPRTPQQIYQDHTTPRPRSAGAGAGAGRRRRRQGGRWDLVSLRGGGVGGGSPPGTCTKHSIKSYITCPILIGLCLGSGRSQRAFQFIPKRTPKFSDPMPFLSKSSSAVHPKP